MRGSSGLAVICFCLLWMTPAPSSALIVVGLSGNTSTTIPVGGSIVLAIDPFFSPNPFDPVAAFEHANPGKTLVVLALDFEAEAVVSFVANGSLEGSGFARGLAGNLAISTLPATLTYLTPGRYIVDYTYDVTGLSSIIGLVTDPCGNQSVEFGILGPTESVSGSGSFTVAVGVVPEPSTWAMLLIGFSGLGFMGYRRRNKMAPAAP